jgi:hypothetical protein
MTAATDLTRNVAGEHRQGAETVEAPRVGGRRRLRRSMTLVAALAIGTGVALHGALPPARQGVEWAWTHVGPDYDHTAADRTAAQVCMVGTAAYDTDRCQAYTEASSTSGLARFPVAQGGTCRLSTRFECARANHLEQWDQDVPWWAPWWLHNGVPGLAFSSLAGALAGLLMLATAIVVGGLAWSLRRLVVWPAIGAVVGAVAMDVVRHQDDLIPLPARYALMAVVLAVAVVLFPPTARAGGAR